MTRLIDADALIEFEEKAWDGSAKEVSPSSLYHIILDDIRDQPTIAAIPIDFIESEKRFVSELSTKAYEVGDIERAKGLSNIALNLDALISNWGFIRGDEWRENRKKAME